MHEEQNTWVAGNDRCFGEIYQLWWSEGHEDDPEITQLQTKWFIEKDGVKGNRYHGDGEVIKLQRMGTRNGLIIQEWSHGWERNSTRLVREHHEDCSPAVPLRVLFSEAFEWAWRSCHEAAEGVQELPNQKKSCRLRGRGWGALVRLLPICQMLYLTKDFLWFHFLRLQVEGIRLCISGT